MFHRLQHKLRFLEFSFKKSTKTFQVEDKMLTRLVVRRYFWLTLSTDYILIIFAKPRSENFKVLNCSKFKKVLIERVLNGEPLEEKIFVICFLCPQLYWSRKAQYRLCDFRFYAQTGIFRKFDISD